MPDRQIGRPAGKGWRAKPLDPRPGESRTRCRRPSAKSRTQPVRCWDRDAKLEPGAPSRISPAAQNENTSGNPAWSDNGPARSAAKSAPGAENLSLSFAMRPIRVRLLIRQTRAGSDTRSCPGHRRRRERQRREEEHKDDGQVLEAPPGADPLRGGAPGQSVEKGRAADHHRPPLQPVKGGDTRAVAACEPSCLHRLVPPHGHGPRPAACGDRRADARP